MIDVTPTVGPQTFRPTGYWDTKWDEKLDEFANDLDKYSSLFGIGSAPGTEPETSGYQNPDVDFSKPDSDGHSTLTISRKSADPFTKKSKTQVLERISTRRVLWLVGWPVILCAWSDWRTWEAFVFVQRRVALKCQPCQLAVGDKRCTAVDVYRPG